MGVPWYHVLKDYDKLNNLKISEILALSQDFLKVESPVSLMQLLELKNSDLLVIQYPEYHSFYLQNTNKKRKILQPENSLMQIQKKLNRYLSCVYYITLERDATKVNPSYSYVISPEDNSSQNVKKKNIVSHAANHIGKELVASIDIKDFFPSITKLRVIDMFMEAPFKFNFELSNYLSDIVTYKEKLPVGAPTSPIISNFIASKFDRIIAAIHNISYSRYSDDITVSSDFYEYEDFLKTVENVVKILESQNFTVNTSKLHIAKSTDRQNVTGIVVNQKLNVGREIIRNLRAILYSIEKNGWPFAAKVYCEKHKYAFIKSVSYYYYNHKGWIIPKEMVFEFGTPRKIYFFSRSIRAKILHVGYVKGWEDPVFQKLIQKLAQLKKGNDFRIVGPDVPIEIEIALITNPTLNSIIDFIYKILIDPRNYNEFSKELTDRYIKNDQLVSIDRIKEDFLSQSHYFIKIYSAAIIHKGELDTSENWLHREIYHLDPNCKKLIENKANKVVKVDPQTEKEIEMVFEQPSYIFYKSYLEKLRMRTCIACNKSAKITK